MSNTNTYWNENGEHQQEYNRMSKLMPDFGYTDNKYMNLLIAMSKVYYRHFNDGDYAEDFNEIINEYIRPFKNINISLLYTTRNYEQDLEQVTNEVIKFLIDKDLSYTELI